MELDESPNREKRDVGDGDSEEIGGHKSRDLSKHRSKDRKKSGHREEKDQGNKEKDKEAKDDRLSSRDRRKDDRDEREKDRRKEDGEEHEKDRSRITKGREKERDYEQRDKHRDKEREREREREREKDRKDRRKDREVEKESDDKEKGKEKSSREKEREREKEKPKEKEREKYRDKGREKEKDRVTDEAKEKSNRQRDREEDHDRDRSRDKERVIRKGDAHDYDRIKDNRVEFDIAEEKEDVGHGQDPDSASDGTRLSTSKLQDRISKAKEERLKRQPESEGASETLAWVNRSRKLEQKRNAEKEKVMRLSKVFEEQDDIGHGESEDEQEVPRNAHDLAGVKVLHGLDKVVEGGAVVLTLKDQNILADGDINEEVDMLENVEIGEQKHRDEAYKAAKKKSGIYDDKFSDDPASEKKMLPQYDDPAQDEGVTLDSSGRLTNEAEKKLEELRRRLQGVSSSSHYEDLTSSAKTSSDYYTQEELLRFRKPKKKKSLRKKEKLDLDALEAEAVSAGLGVGDLGSRKDGRRQASREEQEKIEAEMRKNAFQLAYAKAEEASRLLRVEQSLPVKTENDENMVIADDDEDLYKSLERARKLALKKQEEKGASGPKAIALRASSIPSTHNAENQSVTTGESQESRVVMTEIEGFVSGLEVDEVSRKPDTEDVFMDEDEAPVTSDNEVKDEPGGWTEFKEFGNDEGSVNEDEEEVVPDETIHEAAVGKGLSGALKLLKDRGTLKETVEWGGRNMDKKKSKLVGIADGGQKEIRIERTDEFGRILTPKEAFRLLSHKFHGKGPGKMKQEKRMKQYHEELKLKQMKNSDTPSSSAERMREAQAQMKTPYLVLSGHVKPGQNSDPRSGFATIEKDPGSLTPMLGDRKVEHFLGIKRKPEPSNLGAPKKPKT
ncbi:hypothetical protein ACJRO7_005878 [Eucalyptus globulus]|uniref:SART-1 family protein DOT2 n=1 Tax=Eucalyptus globulus TaxID=34317 RepID=A0ABD3J8J3_EUCGL